MSVRWLGIVLAAAIGFGCGRMTEADDGEDASGDAESVGTGSSGEVDAGGRGGPGDSGTTGADGTAGTGWIDGGYGGGGTGDGRMEGGVEPVGADGESGVGGTGLADGGSGIGELSFVASSSPDNNVAIVLPSEARAGDLAILVDAYIGYFPPGVLPDGWSLISNVFTSQVVQARPPRSFGFRTIVSYRILHSGDTGKRVDGMTAEFGSTSKVILVFRASRSISTVRVKGLSEEATFARPAPQSVTASNGDVPLVVVASYVTTSSIQTLAFLPHEDGEIANGSAFVRYKIFNASPSDVTVDLGPASGTVQSFSLEVS